MINKQSPLKRAVFWFILVFIVIVSLECFSLLYVYVREGKFPPTSVILSKKDDDSSITSTAYLKSSDSPLLSKLTSTRHQIIHPYIGYVKDSSYSDKEISINQHGFFEHISNDDIQAHASDETLTVAFFGGSVSNLFAMSANETFIEKLKEIKSFKDTVVRIKSFAMGGYKQPQQLIALNYLLALGEDIDIVINLDGFNDIALAPQEYFDDDLFPFYPRDWTQRLTGLPNIEHQKIAGQIAYIQAGREEMFRSRIGLPFPLSKSATLYVVWKFFDDRAAKNIHSLQGMFMLSANPNQQRQQVTHGPKQYFASRDDLYRKLAEVWENSSLQMHQVTKANEIDYYHFLQPNQYVRGSKIFSVEENRRFVDLQHPYASPIQDGYDYLADAGEQLMNQGVRFYDLRMIFSHVKETVYIDSCCHLNTKGNELLAAAMIKAIAMDKHKTKRLTDNHR